LLLINHALDALPVEHQHAGVMLPGFLLLPNRAALEIDFGVVATEFPVLGHVRCLVARRRFQREVGGATARAMLLSAPVPVVVLARVNGAVLAASHAATAIGPANLQAGMAGADVFAPSDIPRLLSAPDADSVTIAGNVRWNVRTRGVGDSVVVVFVNPE
jgi:hypothetical protein